jgi:hypothetical protein
VPPPAATDVAAEVKHDELRQQTSASPDQSRPVATAYVDRVESENIFLRQQIGVKDEQIKDLTERARETNHLIAGLQRMLSPLLGAPEQRQGSDSNRTTDNSVTGN